MIHLSETKVWTAEEIKDLVDFVFDPPQVVTDHVTLTREEMEKLGWVFPDEQE
jgi:hypothetical protein